MWKKYNLGELEISDIPEKVEKKIEDIKSS
jgi:hypothetical protein